MRRDVSIVVRATTAVKKTKVPNAGWQTGRQVIQCPWQFLLIFVPKEPLDEPI
jgi:hypothetical protein